MVSPLSPLSFSVSVEQALERGGMQANWTVLQGDVIGSGLARRFRKASQNKSHTLIMT